MKKCRQEIRAWENPTKRKLAVIGLVLTLPISLTYQSLIIIFMDGVPEWWDAMRQLFSRRTIDVIHEGWVGKKHYRENV